MRNLRSYYSTTVQEFFEQDQSAILGQISLGDPSAETALLQRNAWLDEIDVLRDQLEGLEEGRVLFEYSVPRMGKRVDVVLLHCNIVFVLEFKCGDTGYRQAAVDQVYDYALDLRNFQKESHDKLLVPIVVATRAPARNIVVVERDRIVEPILCNAKNLRSAIDTVVGQFHEKQFDYGRWEDSEYLPTPTIVEAATALYRGHGVEEITRSDAGATNLTRTSAAIERIIEFSKKNHRKSICFVTGVPGAGKTLVGLNLAVHRSQAKAGEHAVFLSGNYPLVKVLQEALARDRVDQSKRVGPRVTKSEALRRTSAFIQIIHKYRDSFVGNDYVPPERVVIFDEAQRAWTREEIQRFMSTKKGVRNFPVSEPEFLISTMDRHEDWAVVVCLVGGGQEINRGEAGLPEWFAALQSSFRHWDVYVTPELDDSEYRRDLPWSDLISGLTVREIEELHLATSVRSFRTPALAGFIKAALDVDVANAQRLYREIEGAYPVFVTRDLAAARAWVREQSRGTTRYGLLASSGALRLKPEGVFVKSEPSVANWFLNGRDDVRSSYALEDVATEFDVQGLELDYSIVAWDADYRFSDGGWSHHSFSGSRWANVVKEDRRLFLKNAYRVLLTRARQGMVIFVPRGSSSDATRDPSYYDGTFEYLKSLGIPDLPGARSRTSSDAAGFRVRTVPPMPSPSHARTDMRRLDRGHSPDGWRH